MQWYVRPNTPESRHPEWARSFAVTHDGTLMLPAALADPDNEALVAISACEKTGSPTTAHQGHLYVSAVWLKSEYPDIVPLIERLEATVVEMGLLIAP